MSNSNDSRDSSTYEPPNYRALSAPDHKEPEEYTWPERRAEIYDAIDEVGHYRNLEKTQYEIAERYDVGQSTIRDDIQKVNDWMAENVGQTATAELTQLKNKAVQALIDQDRYKEYRLMHEHVEMLAEVADTPIIKAAERQEIKQEQKMDVDMGVDISARGPEVAYQVVHAAEEEDLPTDEDGEILYSEIGFNEGPEASSGISEEGGVDEQAKGEHIPVESTRSSDNADE